MLSLFRKAKVPKTKRQKIAEHAAMLEFLRSCPEGEDVWESARVIGEDAICSVVEINFSNCRPGNRRFFSVVHGEILATEMSFDEAKKNWGANYDR